MSITNIDSPIDAERNFELRAIKQRLAKSRQSRVVSEISENLELIDRLLAEFPDGFQFATALAAEGFGSAREVRQAAFSLTRRAA